MPTTGARHRTSRSIAGTIQNQRDFLAGYHDLYKLPRGGQYYDDGISGTVPLGDRPEGRRLLEDARAGRFTVLLVYRIDRLGRNLKALLDALDELDRCGVTIKSVTEPFDTAVPIGRFMFQLLGSLAELERATINERTTGGRDRVAADGRYTGGPIPFGYDLDAERRYIPSERLVDGVGVTEAALVRDVFRRVAYEQSTLSAECRRFDALGIPCQKRYPPPLRQKVGRQQRYKQTASPSKNGRGWSPTTLSQIIHNAMYKGGATLESARGGVRRPSPALVDQATWDAAQAAVTRNRQLSKRNAKHDYLLRGLIRCALCRYTYTGHTYGPVGKEQRYYRCLGGGTANRRATARCEGARVNAAKLEAAVWTQVRPVRRSPRGRAGRGPGGPAATARGERRRRGRPGRTAGASWHTRAWPSGHPRVAPEGQDHAR